MIATLKRLYYTVILVAWLKLRYPKRYAEPKLLVMGGNFQLPKRRDDECLMRPGYLCEQSVCGFAGGAGCCKPTKELK
jgi:hypothetical protein